MAGDGTPLNLEPRDLSLLSFLPWIVLYVSELPFVISKVGMKILTLENYSEISV